MEQPLELEGSKIDSMLTEMTDIVRKLQGRNTSPPHADAAMMNGGSPAAAPCAEASGRAAE